MNTARNITDSSIVVQWDEVEDYLLTTAYTVTWTSESNPSNIQSAALIEQSSYTITGLTLDTIYTITVTAANKCGRGPTVITDIIIFTGMYIRMCVCTFVCTYVRTIHILYICMMFLPSLYCYC